MTDSMSWYLPLDVRETPGEDTSPPSLFLTVGLTVSPKGHAESPDNRELGTQKNES